jgi:hypothetical protein
MRARYGDGRPGGLRRVGGELSPAANLVAEAAPNQLHCQIACAHSPDISAGPQRYTGSQDRRTKPCNGVKSHEVPD